MIGFNYEHMKKLGLDGKVELYWSKRDKIYENSGLWRKIVPVGDPSQILISLYNPKYLRLSLSRIRKLIKSDSKKIGEVMDVELRNKPEHFTYYCRGECYYFDSPEFDIRYRVIPISFFVEETATKA